MTRIAEYVGHLVHTLGFSVFPLKPGTKVPLTLNGQDDSSADLTVLTEWSRRWPNANYGIHCAPSGLYVVDVDSGEGKQGGETWAALTTEHGHADTLTVRTQSGGLHFYYRMPPGDALTNTAGKLGKHIDTRGNGYVVAPGSIVNGRTYEVVNDVPIADLPQWVADAVRKPVRPAPAPSATASLFSTVAAAEDVGERVQHLALTLAQTPHGERNDAAARIAFMVGGYVGAGQIPEADAAQILMDAVATWDDQPKTQSTIRRQVAEGAMSPRPWEATRFPTVTPSADDDAAAEADALAARPATGTEDAYPPRGDVALMSDSMVAGDEDDSAGVESRPRENVSDFFTDTGQGRWLANRLPGVAWAPGMGWMLWDGARWKVVEAEAVSSVVRLKYAQEFTRWATKYGTTAAEKDLAMAKGFRRLLNSSSLSGVITGLRDTVYRDAIEFDAHTHLLNTTTGVVDLRTGKISPHDPGLFMTKVTAGGFVPGYRHPDWQKAQEALPADTLGWLQARMGAALAGTQIADDAVFLHGGGSNGKSLFSNDGIVRALGDYAMLKSSDLIASRKADATAATPDKADLKGARFVLIEELPEEFALSTKAVKELAGTGAITARRLYQNALTFDATHSLFVNTNHVPNVTDTDWGTWRRLSLVPFPFTFTSAPQTEGDRKGDRDLVQRVRANVDGQWDAIVTWLVEGAMAVLADPTPLIIGRRSEDDGRAETVKDATRDWRKVCDRLMAYAEDCLTLDPRSAIAKVDLVWHFNRWLQDQGSSKWSARLIGDRMAKHPSYPNVRVDRPRAVPEGASRPDGNGDPLPSLPSRPEYVMGLRFATPRPCVCPNAGHGIHSPNCTTN